MALTAKDLIHESEEQIRNFRNLQEDINRDTAEAEQRFILCRRKSMNNANLDIEPTRDNLHAFMNSWRDEAQKSVTGTRILDDLEKLFDLDRDNVHKPQLAVKDDGSLTTGSYTLDAVQDIEITPACEYTSDQINDMISQIADDIPVVFIRKK